MRVIVRLGGGHIRKVCVIFDEDEIYSYRLMNYLKSMPVIPYEILIFTEKPALLEYLADNEAKVLLTGDVSVLDKAAGFKVEKMLMLLEEPGGTLRQTSDYYSVFKYQSAGNLVKEMVNYCLEGSGSAGYGRTPGGKGRIIGVYSPAGQCYKTTFSLALADALARNGRVLYINLEEYSGLTEGILRRENGSLSEIMYMYRRGFGGISAKINNILGRIGRFEYIPPVEYPEDVVDVLPEEWITFVEFLLENMEFDYIVVDIGNLVKKAWEFFEMMDVVFVPQPEDAMSVNKLKEFVVGINNMGRGILLENVAYVQIPVAKELEGQEISMDKIEWSKVGNYARKVVNERGL